MASAFKHFKSAVLFLVGAFVAAIIAFYVGKYLEKHDLFGADSPLWGQAMRFLDFFGSILATSWFWPTFWGLIGLAIGLYLDAAVRRFAPNVAKVDRRQWFSGYDVFQLADSDILKRHAAAREQFQKLQGEMNELTKEWLAAKNDFDKIKETEQERDKLAPLIDAAKRESEILWTECWTSVQRLLSEGTLIAKGFQKPISENPAEIIIPTEYWRFLVFTDAYKGAQGQGKGYAGVVIARCD
jgi:hypothetical protein